MRFDDLPPSPYWLLPPELQLVVVRVSVRYRQRDLMVERACDENSWRDGSKGAIGHQERQVFTNIFNPLPMATVLQSEEMKVLVTKISKLEMQRSQNLGGNYENRSDRRQWTYRVKAR